MKTMIVNLASISPLSMSRPYEREVPKIKNEKPDDYEKRTWRNKIHTAADGHVFLPPMMLKNGLDNAAAFLGMKFKGLKTYKSIFTSGVMVIEPVVLAAKATDVPEEWIYQPSDGRRGSGKRVWKCFPMIAKWSGEARFEVLHEGITEDVMQEHLEVFGRYVGIGRFRPERGGYYGRFTAGKIRVE